MGIFKWRGRVSKSEFRRQFVETLRDEAPQLECTPSEGDELEITISGMGNDDQAVLSLHRAYDEFEQDPLQRDAIFNRFKSLLLQQRQDLPLETSNVVPMIKARSWLEDQYARDAEPPAAGSDAAFWVDDYNDELVVVYAEHREGFSYRPRGDFAAVGLNPQNIRALALRNLRSRTPRREFSPVNGAWLLDAEGAFEASLLLDDEVWKNHRFRDSREVLAAVPERDCLFASTDTTPLGVWNLATLVDHGYRSAQYPISPQLMMRNSGHFTLVDSREIDDTHPIPNLTVIDVHGVRESGGSVMSMIIATPMDATPRSIFRLFRKLTGHLDYKDTAEYREQCGDGMTDIEVSIHPDSDAAVFDLLAVLPDFVERHGARLAVKPLE
jgi:uncharacterized protein YtpQ (UPF0354 family)